MAKLPSGPAEASFYGVSCPSTSLCVAVGGNGTVAASTQPTGGSSAWRVGRPAGSIDLPGGLPEGTGTPYYAGAQIRGVSCPSTGLCVAASLDGRFYSSTDPAGSPSAWKVVKQAESGPNIHMFGISCPSTGLCVVAGYGGKVLFSTNPTGDREDWTVTQLSQPFDFRGISCPSVDFCVAVGNEGNIVASTNPTGGPSAWKSLGAPGGGSGLNGISCPSTSFCVTGNAGTILTSTNPTSAGGWSAVNAGTGLPITGVSCPSLSACAAVDNNADVIASTEPAGGERAWWFQNVIPYGTPDGNGMFGISCATTALCVAVGQRYQLMTSTNPFEKPAPKPAGKGKRKGKRPRAVITHHPAKRLDPRKGGVRVAFRFRATVKRARFQCKLDNRRFRKCKPPKRYRAGRGKHVFRVRAIAPGGLKGPPTTFHFRVGKLTERPPVGSCKGEESSITKPCING